MELFKQIMDLVGYIGTIWLLLSGLLLFISALKGVLIPLWRLGLGLSKRKITIFAKGDNKESFEKLLLDTKLFDKNNITTVTKKEDFGRCEKSTLFLVVWDDYGSQLKEILNKKQDGTALIVYAKPRQLTDSDWSLLDEHRNVSVVNLRGRLFADILISLMVTGYDKR